MKANELMIGDWVGYLPTWKNEDGSIDRDGDPNDPIPFKVETVYWDCVDLDDREGGSFDADDISLYPIPLTREILEKNKFCKNDNEYIYRNTANDGYVYVMLQDMGCGTWDITIKNYDKFEDKQTVFKANGVFLHLHELQHSMRLCDIEKEIDL